MKIRRTGPAGHRTEPMRTMLAQLQSIIGCLRFYMPGTRRYRVADTWRLYPTHCATPKISDTERTIIQATDTLTALSGTVPSSTSESIAQSHTIQQLRNILMLSL